MDTNKTSPRFPDKVYQMLKQGGWFPGRNVELEAETLPENYTLFEKAEQALREFAGVKAGVSGPGRDCAASDVGFRPELGKGLAEVTGLATESGRKIYPLGIIDSGHAYFLIDEDGAVYMYFDELESIAPSLDQALIDLLLGQKSSM